MRPGRAITLDPLSPLLEQEPKPREKRKKRCVVGRTGNTLPSIYSGGGPRTYWYGAAWLEFSAMPNTSGTVVTTTGSNTSSGWEWEP